MQDERFVFDKNGDKKKQKNWPVLLFLSGWKWEVEPVTQLGVDAWLRLSETDSREGASISSASEKTRYCCFVTRARGSKTTSLRQGRQHSTVIVRA